MRIARILRARLRPLIARGGVERELEEELQYHLDRQIEENLAAGMAAGDARLAALRSLGGLQQRKEECRDMRGWNPIDNLRQDLRFSLRQLATSPGFACTAVFVLALGICAATSIFAFADAALLQPFPYARPARLVSVYERIGSCPLCNLSYPDFLDWKQCNSVFMDFDIYQSAGYSLATATAPEPVRAARITSGFLHTLGTAPVLGRDFTPADNVPNSPRTALLSYGSWQRRYHADPGVVGQAVRLNGEPVTIVGVLAREFHFAPVGQPGFWVAYRPESGCDKRRSCHGLYGVARLKDGVSVESALANVTVIAAQLEREYPDSNRGQGAAVTTLAETILGPIRPILMALLGGAALLLLIAIVNVAGLLLVRSESRRREIAVRTALGAGSGRLLAQFVTESLVLVASGAALGLLGARWSIALLKGLISENMMAGLPFLAGLRLNDHAVLFAAAVALAAAVLASLPPLLATWTSNAGGGLTEAARGSSGTVWRRLGSRLVVVELACAVVLLAGAGLLGKSLYFLLRVNMGLRPEHVVTIDLSLPASIKSDERQASIAREVLDRVRSIPGVASAGVAGLGIPLGGNGNTTWFRIVGHPWNGEHNDTPMREVSVEYFPTLGAQLLQGRYFQESDDKSKPQVAIINQAFARVHFPGENPVGRQIKGLSPDAKPVEIVGVVADIREGPLDTAIPPVLYYPFNQSPENYFSLVVRGFSEGPGLLSALRAAAHQVNPEIVPIGGTTMVERIESSYAAYVHRSLAWLVGCFAAVALVLGIVGLYGVIAYSVSRRSREIGIRMALGAQTGAVYGMILREAGRLAAVGIAIGAAGAVGAAGLMRNLLFGVRMWDAATLLSVAVLLGVAALAASLIPARRAVSVNPVDALRAD